MLRHLALLLWLAYCATSFPVESLATTSLVSLDETDASPGSGESKAATPSCALTSFTVWM